MTVDNCKPENCHYHVWMMADTQNAFFRVRRPYATRQAAHKAGLAVNGEPGWHMVRKCTDPECLTKAKNKPLG